MAKPILSTNYKDDILNVSTEGKRKYRMNYNDDGTVSFDDVTPYDQEGSNFGAGDINLTNEAVNQSFDKNKLIRDMDAINAITKEGYAPDALALKEVNNSLGAKLLWTNPNPSVVFQPQTLNLDLSKYSYVKIVSTYSINRLTMNFVDDGIVGYGGQIRYNTGRNIDGDSVNIYRLFSVSTTGIAFKDGFLNSTIDDTYAIPLAIYGCK